MKTFVIAEVGINHGGDLQVAKDLVYATKDSGCSAVKFQTYQTDKRVTKDSPIYDILKRCEMSYDDQAKVKEYADSVGIEFFSTPFDYESLDFLLDDLNISRIKIASFDVTNTDFLTTIGHRALPNVILSTGMANSTEIYKAVNCLRPTVYPKQSIITILHCVSAYPLSPTDANLNAIKKLKLLYSEHPIGYSDHTDDILVPSLSVLAGAEVIEKHFTLDKNGPAVDNPVSVEPTMMRKMIRDIKMFEQILGDGSIGMSNAEKGAEQFRRKS